MTFLCVNDEFLEMPMVWYVHILTFYFGYINTKTKLIVAAFTSSIELIGFPLS